MKLLELMQIIECEITLGVSIAPAKDGESGPPAAHWHASCNNVEIQRSEIILGSSVGFGDTALKALKELAKAMSRRTIVKHAGDLTRRKEWSLPSVTV